uniref:Scaffolding anchor of CK1 domain-containing protein n=1 Tax=Eptatretus burgeri TaxID=7764 RepID=A0A8C4N449_EPTBU
LQLKSPHMRKRVERWRWSQFLQLPSYKEEYRMAIDILIEEGRDAYFGFLDRMKFPEFLSEIDIEHIERHLQRPLVRDDRLSGNIIGGDVMEHETDLCSSSSGTYWPMDTEISAPDLELGWPSPTHFLGPTNVAVHFHPPVGEYVPTIKQIVQKHINEARKLVAVVMDIFTDVDIFEALVEAATTHRVPVYILHDEINFPYFDKMCQQHGLDPKRLQVRTLPGCCYHCKSGMKFSGQTLGKLLLIDFEIVICGTYSFTWAHEKIHRSMVEVFAGEIVQMFEEEFRILYAQSRSVVTQPEVKSHKMNTNEEDSKQHENISAKEVEQEEPIKAASRVGQEPTGAIMPSSEPSQNSTVLPQPSSISTSTSPIKSGSVSLHHDTAVVSIPEESNADNSGLVKEDHGGETQEKSVKTSAESQGDAAANSAKEVKGNTGEEDEGDEGNSGLLEKIEHMRKDNKVYSRFEVFYKQDGVEKDPKTSPVRPSYMSGYSQNRSTYRPFLSSYRSSNHFGSEGYRSTSSDRTLNNFMQRLKFSKRSKRY